MCTYPSTHAVFCLFGDDIRLYFCYKKDDAIFYAGYIMALTLFIGELTANSIVQVTVSSIDLGIN